MWWGPRLGRGDLIFAIIVVNVVYLAAVYLLTDRFSFVLDFGFRSNLSSLERDPIAFSILAVAVDLVILSLVWRRLQDFNRPGWTLIFLPLLPLLFGTVGALVSLIAILALIFFPPTIGPNRFGPDPRGWKSPEHFREQQDRLKPGAE